MAILASITHIKLKYNLYVVDCGEPTTPASGKVTLTPAGVTTYGATATQSCNPGYDLSGSASISCGVDGFWSALPVTCTLKGMHTTKCECHIYERMFVKVNNSDLSLYQLLHSK